MKMNIAELIFGLQLKGLPFQREACHANTVTAQVRGGRDGSFSSNVGQIGPQIGHIREFFSSDFSTIGSSSQMY